MCAKKKLIPEKTTGNFGVLHEKKNKIYVFH